MRRAAPCLLPLVTLLCACDHPAPEGAAPAISASVGSPSPSSASVETSVAEASAPSSMPVEAAAPPAVRVENIGMHIGGGPNDAVSKAPIGDSVAPHFDELRACWAQVGDVSRGGDFGVDLLIPADGGRAAVSHPRTSLGPDAFRDCVVAVFSAIDFRKPRTGRTTVSYSLRFTPLQ
jgi:hypothetical protein